MGAQLTLPCRVVSFETSKWKVDELGKGFEAVMRLLSGEMMRTRKRASQWEATNQDFGLQAASSCEHEREFESHYKTSQRQQTSRLNDE
jgi:hypothetical protein